MACVQKHDIGMKIENLKSRTIKRPPPDIELRRADNACPKILGPRAFGIRQSLHRIEGRIAEARRLISQQKGLITRLRAAFRRFKRRRALRKQLLAFAAGAALV